MSARALSDQSPALRADLWLWIVLIVACVVCDQLTKMAVVSLSDGQPFLREVFPFLNIVMVWNRGVSFGLLGDLGLGIWPFVCVALLLTGVLGVWMARAVYGTVACAFALMAGGALGNVIDRIRWGAVADFIDFHVAGWHFWAFNLADTWISVGAMVLIADNVYRCRSRC